MAPLARSLFAAAVAVALVAAVIEEEEDVLVLDDANFEEAVKAHNPLLVEFYAPWCGHCKRLAPEYAKAAGELKAAGLRIAKMDATVSKDVPARFGVQGFPTLKFFRGDAASVSEYNGPREAAGIVSWVTKKAGPATAAVASVAEAEAFAAKHEVAYIGFFSEPGSPGARAFAAAAAATDDLPFATSASDAVRAAYGVPAGADGVVSVNAFKGEANRRVFGGAVDDAAALRAFIDDNALPAVIAFTQESAPKIFRGAIKTHFLLFADDKAEGYDAAVGALRGAAASGKGKALFVTVDPSQDRVVSYFGVTTADMPTAVIVNMPENEPMKKFAWPAGTPLTQSAMEAFFADYTAGKLKPHLKSEPVVTGEEDAPVKTVVGKSFADIVLDASKDVLLEFYAPWCGHCKALAPEWEKLGQKFKDAGAAASSVVIAKMDATANEVDFPGVNVKGFPTIILFPASRDGSPKKAVEFEGSRDIDGFTDFLRNAGFDAAASSGPTGSALRHCQRRASASGLAASADVAQLRAQLQQVEALRQQLESDIAVLTENFEQLKLAQSKFADSLAALGALGGAEPRSILVPMTSSLYVPGTLVPGVPVLVDVGTSFIVGKTPAAAAETFSKKIAALKASTEQIVKLVNEKKRDAGELEAISAQLNSQLARLAPPQQA